MQYWPIVALLLGIGFGLLISQLLAPPLPLMKLVGQNLLTRNTTAPIRVFVQIFLTLVFAIASLYILYSASYTVGQKNLASGAFCGFWFMFWIKANR